MNKLLPFLMISLCGAAGYAADLHIAPSGDDAGLGSLEKPFATLQRARDEVRKLRAASPKEPVTVYLRGGIHSLPDGLKLDAKDSGSADAPVIWRAYQKEQPILVGGREVKNFTPYQGAILKADLKAQGFKNPAFKQLIFDGSRQHLARYPNFDAANPYGGGWAYADGKYIPMYQDVPGEDRHSFTPKAADTRTWARPEEVEVFVFARYNWWNNICRIKSIDADSRKITLAQDASYPIRPSDRYYFRNALEELDAPGEWYLDQKSSTLYFWPPAPLAGRSVVAPTTRTILEINGAEHITFRGLTVECSEGTAIVLKDSKDCLIATCVIRNVGDYSGSGVSVSGGARNGVAGCDISHVGSSAITLSGGDRIKLTPAGHYADNNYIHHTGVFYKQGVGVSLSGCGNRASHNLIHDCPRFGIGFGGNNLLIEFNHIRHVNLETADTGAVYTGGRDWLGSRGTVIRHNYFHDILGYGFANGKWESPHFAWGVYLDDNTGGVDVIGNVVARAVRGLVHLHNGRDNLIDNNIFIGAKLQQMECGGWTETHSYWISHLPTMIKGYESVMNEPAWKSMRNMQTHPTKAVLPDGKIMSGNVFQRNIVYWNDPKAKYVSFRNFSYDHNQCDRNLVWNSGHPILTGVRKVGKDIGPELLAGGSWNDAAPGAMANPWRWQGKPEGAKAAIIDDAGNQALQLDAALVTKDGKKSYPIVVGPEFELPPGKSYRLSARVKATAGSVKGGLMLQSYISNVYFWASSPGEFTAEKEWKRVEFVFRTPAQGEKGWHEKMKLFRARIDNSAAEGAIVIDDLSLKEAAPLDEWQSWQSVGMDRNSLIADPMFVDPAKDDYRLKPESPAFKLGFKPIPVEKIGPYASDLRASWPIIEAEGAREKPLAP